MNLYVHIPSEISKVIKRLIDRDWLVAPFKAQGEDLYNPAAYLYNIEIEKMNYKVYLDLNIFSYALASLKKTTRDTRDAIALITFCQFCKIVFEPSLAIYEKINYRQEIPDSIINDLNLFRKIDSSQPYSLVQYALGQADAFNLNTDDFVEDRIRLKHELGKYKRLAEWDSMYLFVLKLVHLDKENNKETKEKLFEFISWMHGEFRYSLVATVFAQYLFSPERKRNMLKYKSSDSRDNKKKQLNNMTWDLYIMNWFFRRWENKNINDEFLIASNDKILKEVLMAAINIQTDTGMNYLRQNHPDWQAYFQKINSLSNTSRAYKSENWTPEYRSELIDRYETLLL
jgi:hypothetical protein